MKNAIFLLMAGFFACLLIVSLGFNIAQYKGWAFSGSNVKLTVDAKLVQAVAAQKEDMSLLDAVELRINERNHNLTPEEVEKGK